MDRQYYEKQFALEDSHWWYQGRRNILQRVLRRFYDRFVRNALEIGCGGGCNLSTLASFADQVTAIEMEKSAVDIAIQRNIGEITQGKLGDDLPVLKRSYDVIGMFDVLEHIQDDAKALKQVSGLLAPGGRLFITVPAYMLLWTEHDEIAHHYRRYTLGGLKNLLQTSGFRVVHASYLNSFLFPLALVERMLTRFLKLDPARSFNHPPRPVNRLLSWLFSLEAGLVASLGLPFGLSVLVVAQADETPPPTETSNRS